MVAAGGIPEIYNNMTGHSEIRWHAIPGAAARLRARAVEGCPAPWGGRRGLAGWRARSYHMWLKECKLMV